MHTQLSLRSRTHWCKPTVRPTGKLILNYSLNYLLTGLQKVHIVVYEQKDTEIELQVHTSNFCNILSAYTQQ